MSKALKTPDLMLRAATFASEHVAPVCSSFHLQNRSEEGYVQLTLIPLMRPKIRLTLGMSKDGQLVVAAAGTALPANRRTILDALEANRGHLNA